MYGIAFCYYVKGNYYDVDELVRTLEQSNYCSTVEWTAGRNSYHARETICCIHTNSSRLPTHKFLEICPASVFAILMYRVKGNTIALQKKKDCSRFVQLQDDSIAYSIKQEFLADEFGNRCDPGEYGIPDEMPYLMVYK